MPAKLATPIDPIAGPVAAEWERSKIPIRELAERVGSRHSNLLAWFGGRRAIPLDTRARVLELLNLEIVVRRRRGGR